MAADSEFTTFVAARQSGLLRLGWLLAADGDFAHDLVQEALVRTYRRWNHIAPEARERYVRQAMRTIWIDQWRRGRRRVELVADLPDTPARDDGPEAVASRVTLDQALARLSRGQRLVLVLRFYEDLPE